MKLSTLKDKVKAIKNVIMSTDFVVITCDDPKDSSKSTCVISNNIVKDTNKFSAFLNACSTFLSGLNN